MKIIVKDEEQSTTLESVRTGDVFRWEDLHCLRLEMNDFASPVKGNVFVVDLADGEVFELSNDEPITFVKAEVIING